MPLRPSLYDFFNGEAELKEIIQKSDLPTLDFIPESPELDKLDMKLFLEAGREYQFTKKLLPELEEYDVIIFDHAPSTHMCAQNGLIASDVVIVPLACEVTANQAVETNLETLTNMLELSHAEIPIIMVPTRLNTTAISQSIYGKYLNNFEPDIVPIPIREFSKGEEAILNKESYIEYAPSSALAQEFYRLMIDLWERITYIVSPENAIRAAKIHEETV